MNYTEQEHQRFMAQGYLRLGRLLNDDALRALQHIDAIMLGAIPYLTMSFQLDSTTGEYRNLPSDTPDHKAPRWPIAAYRWRRPTPATTPTLRAAWPNCRQVRIF
ncbi:MAG: hypothetical protein R3A44_06415 [Caldilineaceae bacterium]